MVNTLRVTLLTTVKATNLLFRRQKSKLQNVIKCHLCDYILRYTH